MKNKLKFLFFALFLPGIAWSATYNADSCFVNMPMEILPNLPVNSKKDLVDFYKNGRTAIMPESFGGEMTLKTLSDDYIMLQTSSQTSMQLKMLKEGDGSSYIIALIFSAYAPLKDSRMQFYTSEWKPLNSIVAPKFTGMDFFDSLKAGKELSERFSKLCMRSFVYMEFQPDNNNLQAWSSIKEDIPDDLLKDFIPYIKDSVTVSWQNGYF